MDKFLRTALLVLCIVVLAALLFNLGIQLYGLIAGPAFGAFRGAAGPMMGGRGVMHAFGGGFGFLGSILGIALVGLTVAGILALVRSGARSDEAGGSGDAGGT